jgi:hypothetical protein
MGTHVFRWRAGNNGMGAHSAVVVGGDANNGRATHILPCVVFAKIIPIAALGVFTKRLRRSEWRFLALK